MPFRLSLGRPTLQKVTNDMRKYVGQRQGPSILEFRSMDHLCQTPRHWRATSFPLWVLMGGYYKPLDYTLLNWKSCAIDSRNITSGIILYSISVFMSL